MAASPESLTVLADFLGNGADPPLHTHDGDLFFVVLEGSTTLRLGPDSHQAKGRRGDLHSQGAPARQRQPERRAGTPSRDPDTSWCSPEPRFCGRSKLPVRPRHWWPSARHQHFRPAHRGERPRKAMGDHGGADRHARGPANGGRADRARRPGHVRLRDDDRLLVGIRRAHGGDRGAAGCGPSSHGDRYPGRRAVPHLELLINAGPLPRRRCTGARVLRKTRPCPVGRNVAAAEVSAGAQGADVPGDVRDDRSVGRIPHRPGPAAGPVRKRRGGSGCRCCLGPSCRVARRRGCVVLASRCSVLVPPGRVPVR